MNTQVTQEQEAPPPPLDLERVYLVGAENVARFYELMDSVPTTPAEGTVEAARAELVALWDVVSHVANAFHVSKIVKVKFR